MSVERIGDHSEFEVDGFRVMIRAYQVSGAFYPSAVPRYDPDQDGFYLDQLMAGMITDLYDPRDRYDDEDSCIEGANERLRRAVQTLKDAKETGKLGGPRDNLHPRMAHICACPNCRRYELAPERAAGESDPYRWVCGHCHQRWSLRQVSMTCSEPGLE